MTIPTARMCATLTDQIRKSQIAVRDDALDLMELGKMGRIDGLVPEHAVDTEQLGRLEPSRLVRDLVQHRGRDGRRVRAQNEARRLLLREGVAVPCRAEAAGLVDRLDALVVVFWEPCRGDWVCESALRKRRGPR